MGRVATLRHDASVRPDTAVCIHLLRAVRLIVVFALAAFQAGIRLCADADALTSLDVGNFGTNFDGFAYNLYGNVSV
jgi:hypothetical protein